MQILVTGASGFVASCFLPFFSRLPEHTVFGFSNHMPQNTNLAPNIILNQLDVTSYSAVDTVLSNIKPDVILHLAAQASVPDSYTDPFATFDTNVNGTLNLLEACRKNSKHALFIYVSSADVYGGSFHQAGAVDETTPLLPLNPYAASKVAAETLVRQYAQSFSLSAVICRPFNHIGPGQSDKFVVSGFARQIAEIEKGVRPPVIKTGNLAVQRDFLPVENVIQAYLCLLSAKRDDIIGQTFNICSGRSITIQTILDSLLSLSTHQIEVQNDPELYRPNDIFVVQGDNSKFTCLFPQWSPGFDLRVTLENILKHLKTVN